MDKLNCPNCGAPLGLKDVCEYCGTHFMDCTMDTEKPFYIKVRHGDSLLIDRVWISHFSMAVEPETESLYADGAKILTVCSCVNRTYNIELESMGVNI